MKEFTIKSYGFSELSTLFSPEITAASASKQLKRWIENNQNCMIFSSKKVGRKAVND